MSQIAQALVSGAETLPQLTGKNRAGGRLNAAGAMRELGDDVPHDGGSPGKGGDGGGIEKLSSKKFEKKKRCRHRQKKDLNRHGRRRCRRRK